MEKNRTVVYHRSDSSSIHQAEKDLKTLLVPFIEKGGSLLLSMESVRLLNTWEIEPQPLEVEYQDAKDHGFGRAVGFHGYREHPIYEGLFGGAYVWKAKVDNQARTLGFSNNNDNIFYPHVFYFSSNTDVQCGHLVASISILLLQYGHFFVVGAAGFSSFLPKSASLFIPFTRRNTINAIIIKLITSAINAPTSTD